MIIQEKTSKPIDRIAISEEKKFQIKASAKAFKLLSSTIYPDPIAAPIRELATNAHDSHVEAGVSDKFIVHLPNDLEPYFSIRDFGTGMSEETVDKVYCTYFESTRSESNEFTGAFGLGSKTPFCYSDTFNITSFYNGMKYFYTAFLESGEPKLAKFAESQTNEKNGVLISFPVKPEDFSVFKEKAAVIYNRFKNKPKIVGCDDVNLIDDKYVFSGNDWRIREDSNDNRCFAVMGNIAYPIDFYKIGCAYGHAISDLGNIGLEIDFPTGTFVPSVSREDLQYGPETNKKIIDKLSEVKKELINVAREKVESSKRLYDAMTSYFKLVSYQDETLPRGLQAILRNSGFIFDGKVINNTTVRLDHLYVKYCELENINKSEYIHDYSIAHSITSGNLLKKLKTDQVFYFNYDPRIKYFNNDEPNDVVRQKKLKYYLMQNNITQGVFIFNKNSSRDQFYIKELDIPDELIMSIADLPIPPKVTVARKATVRNPKNIKKLDYCEYGDLPNGRKFNSGQESIDLNVCGEIYYISLSHGDITFPNTYCYSPFNSPSSSYMISMVKKFNKLTGKKVKKIYIHSKSKGFGKNIPTCAKNFFVEFESAVNSFIADKKIFLNNTFFMDEAHLTTLKSILELGKKNRIFNNELASNICKIVNSIQDIENKNQESLKELNEILKIQFINVKYCIHPTEYVSNKKQARELISELITKIPILKIIPTFSNSSSGNVSEKEYFDILEKTLNGQSA